VGEPSADIIGIVISLFFSAFLSGSETALTSLSEHKTLALMEAHPTWGRGLRYWVKDHVGLLTTILIGNNVANVTASALATDLAGFYFAAPAIPIAIGAMTFLLLFTGEITPKALARAYADRWSLTLIYVVLAFHVLVFPISWLLTRIIRAVIYLLGGRLMHSQKITERDIELLLTLGTRDGAIDREEETLLNSFFEFSDTVAKEIMVPRTEMVVVSVDSSFDKVVEVAVETGFSRIPVYEESIDKIVGIFYTKDLIKGRGPDGEPDFLRSRMRPPAFIPLSKKISQVLKMFQNEHIQMAIVVNEFGGTEGIVTMEDIMEELFGEIQDEFDTEEKRWQTLTGGRYEVDARAHIEEVAELLGVEFPEERDYESLGGYLMAMAGEVPAVGWTHRHQGFVFRVTHADVNRAIKILVEPAPSETPAEPEEETEPLAADGTKTSSA